MSPRRDLRSFPIISPERVEIRSRRSHAPTKAVVGTFCDLRMHLATDRDIQSVERSPQLTASKLSCTFADIFDKRMVVTSSERHRTAEARERRL